MVEPLEFRIMERLAANHAAIAKDRGFFFDVDDAAVSIDAAVDAEALKDRPVVVVIEPGDSESWQYEPGRQALVLMRAWVTWIASPLPLDHSQADGATTIDRRARQLALWRACADTARTLVEDPSLGGLVVDTRIVGRKWDREIDGLDVYVSIDLEIRTRRDFTRPGAY